MLTAVAPLRIFGAMTKIPLTRIEAAPKKSESIRAAVRSVSFPPAARRRLAAPGDSAAFHELIADPRVSDPIYTLPKPPTLSSASAFIDRHIAEQTRGEGLLIFEFDEAGRMSAYHDIQFWPEWAVCELGGAVRPDRQGEGAGGAGAAAAFDWLFGSFGVDLICETAALNNIRTRKLLERIGFRLVGEIESELPGGGARQSLYFELTRAEWIARQRSTMD